MDPPIENNFFNMLDSVFGGKLSQMYRNKEELIQLLITEKCKVSLIHPLVVLFCGTFIPLISNCWIWLQIPLYLVVVWSFNKWCRYVGDLRHNISQQQADYESREMPALEICKNSADEEKKIQFFHLKDVHNKETTKQSEECVPVLTLADLRKDGASAKQEPECPSTL